MNLVPAVVLIATSLALPGGPPVGMDYLAYDRATNRVWVPAGNTGRVDVIDADTGVVTPIEGFATAPSPRAGRPPVGPSSVTIAGGTAWIGDRADHSLCPVDGKTLHRGACTRLDASPDGIAWVPSTRELWVTTPRENALAIVGAGGTIAKLSLAGRPEGYAVDAARGRFYTNLEDRDRTLAIDVATRKVVGEWPDGCGGEGPRGLAIDEARRLLFVACTDGVVALDLAHDGHALGRLHTGSGVDNLDYAPATHLLYVASSGDGQLTIARVDDGAHLAVLHTAATAPGARNAVVAADGTAYVADSRGGKIHVVRVPRR